MHTACEFYKTETNLLTPRLTSCSTARSQESAGDSIGTISSKASPKRPATALEYTETKMSRAELKKKWIEEIVRNRIYEQEGLDELFQREIIENGADDLGEKKRVWEEVMNEINNS